MNININLTKNLKFKNNIIENLDFPIVKDKKKYPISLKLFSNQDGIHYVNILVTLNTTSRAFSIPVYVGEYEKSLNLKQSNSSNFIINRAEGTIVK